MDVVAYLPPPLRAALRIAVGRAHSVHDAEDWQAVARIARRSPVDVLIVDPMLGGDVGARAVTDLARRHVSLPVVLYTSLTAPAMRAIGELSAAGVHQVVLHGFDDAPRRFLDVIEQQTGMLLGDVVLERLAPAIERLPMGLAHAVRRMLRRSGEVTNASQLAAMAGMPRRTLYRTCEAAGFASPSVMVRAARLLHAYAQLQDAGQSAGDVVEKLGYSSRQLFWRHVWETFDMRPSDLRRDMRPDEFARRLAAVLCSDTRPVRRARRTDDDGAPGAPAGGPAGGPRTAHHDDEGRGAA